MNDGQQGAGSPAKLARLDWLILLILLVAAAALRLLHLGRDSLWFDELWTWKVANQPDVHTLVTTGLREDIHMPAYFVIVYGLIKTFGDSEIVLRMPSVVFSALSAPVLYLLGRRLVNRTVGLIAAVFLVFDAQSIYYGQEARPYAMMLFLAVLSSYLWYELILRIKGDTRAPWVLVAGLWLTLALSCYTHYFDIVLVLLQFLVFFVIAGREKRGVGLGIGMLAGLILIGLLWIAELRLQMQNLVNWIPVQAYLETLRLHIDLTYTWNQYGPFVPFAEALSVLAVLYSLLFLYRGEWPWLRGETKAEYAAGWVLLLLWLAPWLITEVLSNVWKPIYWPRYLIFCLPFAYLLLAMQLNRLKLKADLKVCAAVLYLAVSLLWLENRWGIFSKPQRDDWRGVEQTMAQQAPPDTAVLAVTERPGVAKYYLNQFWPTLNDYAETTTVADASAAVNNLLSKHPHYVWFFTGQYRGHEDVVRAAFNDLRPYIAEQSSPIKVHDVAAFLIKLKKG